MNNIILELENNQEFISKMRALAETIIPSLFEIIQIDNRKPDIAFYHNPTPLTFSEYEVFIGRLAGLVRRYGRHFKTAEGHYPSDNLNGAKNHFMSLIETNIKNGTYPLPQGFSANDPIYLRAQRVQQGEKYDSVMIECAPRPLSYSVAS
jgi:hypothetical protein